jgi:hypothetical protein
MATGTRFSPAIQAHPVTYLLVDKIVDICAAEPAALFGPQAPDSSKNIKLFRRFRGLLH